MLCSGGCARAERAESGRGREPCDKCVGGKEEVEEEEERSRSRKTRREGGGREGGGIGGGVCISPRGNFKLWASAASRGRTLLGINCTFTIFVDRVVGFLMM